MKKEEILIYAKMKKTKINEKNKNNGLISKKVNLWISDLEKKHLEIKNAIVNSLLKIEKLQ